MKSPLFLIASALAMSLAVAGEVSAADLPAKAPIYAKAPVLAPAFSWQRCYIGAHAGYGWGRSDWEGDILNTSGFLGGGQAGCNWQPQGNLVIGIEGEVWWSGLRQSALIPLEGLSLATARNLWDADLALRLGFAANRTLFYAKGGGAYGSFSYSLDTGTLYSGTSNRFGWLAGLGVEHALDHNWTIKLEYNYIDFGRADVMFTAPNAGGGTISIAERKHVVKIGVNYLFGGPVVARY